MVTWLKVLKDYDPGPSPGPQIIFDDSFLRLYETKDNYG